MNTCIAHRGWSGRAPENTMAAIQLAMEEPWIDAIEIDVQLSRDGVPVLIHDYTLERTTNGSGWVGDHTYAELAALDAGSWFAPEFRGERIARLEEVLAAVRGKMKLDIELKKPAGRYEGLEETVAALIRRYNMHDQVFVTSFNHEAIRKIKAVDANLQTGLISYGLPTLIEEQLRYTEATILALAYPYLEPEFVARMHDRGIRMIAWTIDDPGHIKQVMAIHPELAICTNHPDRMLPLMNA